MSFQRIKAILLQEFYVTKRSMEVLVDIFYFAIINIVIFGFVSLYLSRGNKQSATYILIGMILWEVVRVVQYSVSVGVMWNLWSRNLSNMFVSPMSAKEYIAAQMLSGVIKSLIVLVVISVVSAFVFHFNILSLGLVNLILFFINLTIFAWWIGIFILGLLFRYGTKIQALAWSLIYLFQPVVAALYPVNILPESIQRIAYLLPATYVFEAARQTTENHNINWEFAIIAFLQNLMYLVISIWFFSAMFSYSKKSGQFARMEG